MKVSIIVAVYKDVEALRLIVLALQTQTCKNFELIVAEDGESQEMRDFIASVKDLDIKHTTQADRGVRKARSQNNAVLASSGEYLIFIDGDCIPYKNFIEGHLLLAQKDRVLTGRRFNIPQEMVKKINNGFLNIKDIEENLWKYFYLIFNKSVRFRQGIYINPSSFLYRIINKREITATILGCNFSCFREDMITLNGFDESYGETAIPDDIDLEWRFKAKGLHLKSCKNVANMFHLDHTIHDRGDATVFLALMNERKKIGKFRCELGLNTHAK